MFNEASKHLNRQKLLFSHFKSFHSPTKVNSAPVFDPHVIKAAVCRFGV